MPPASPVVDTSRSPHARLKPISLGAVTLRDTFWQPRRAINAQTTLPSQGDLMEETGRLPNFRHAVQQLAGEVDVAAFEGIFFNDSDVYKWLEAVASSLAETPDATLEQWLETATLAIEGAQEKDGYLDTYYTLHPEKDRWENLEHQHQMYCMGHFLQAAIAHERATGNGRLLAVAKRIVDCLHAEFGEGKRQQTDGHPEIELALVEFFRLTGDQKALRLAQFFIDIRGQKTIGGNAYHQDHVPFRQLDRMVGHAVRALYLAAGATDLALETSEAALWEILETQWRNLTQTQQYVTGGAGSRYEGEAFGRDYELPNERAYTETCAAIATVMWAWRMGQKAGEARFFDALERSLYNGVISGLSLSGDEYFYQNPLRDDGTHRRQGWFGCACCPPNIARLLAQLPSYFYSVEENGVWAHLFAAHRAELQLPDGHAFIVEQETNYPWDGEVLFRIVEAPTDAVSLHIRIPAWARGATLGGSAVESGQYAEINRIWKDGDEIRLTLLLPVEKIAAHPFALENIARVALQRGPLVYCLESADNPDIELRNIRIAPDTSFEAISCPDILGGIVMLEGEAEVCEVTGWTDGLYRPIEEANRFSTTTRKIALKAIPYYAWANREAGPMQVWLGVASNP